MILGDTPTDDLHRHREAYLGDAERIARAVLDGTDGTSSPRMLADAVQCALVEHGHVALRQLLTQISVEIDLLDVPVRNEKRVTNLRSALERATLLTELFFERSSTMKLMIAVDPEAFDLGQAVQDTLQRHHLLHEGARLRTDISLAPVFGDRVRLDEAIIYLVSRFYVAARADEHVIVSLRAEDGIVRGFVGLQPSHISSSALMQELGEPFSFETLQVDIPYARAVFERHGGLLFLATHATAVGFGFTIPANMVNA